MDLKLAEIVANRKPNLLAIDPNERDELREYANDPTYISKNKWAEEDNVRVKREFEKSLTTRGVYKQKGGNEFITNFRGDHYFLSNLYPCKITYDGLTYYSVEAAFHAQKFPKPLREPFTKVTGKESIKLQRAAKDGGTEFCGKEWDEKKMDVMERLLAIKFASGTEEARLLKETGKKRLVEGTPDNSEWGCMVFDDNKGKEEYYGWNHLGRLLEARRGTLYYHDM